MKRRNERIRRSLSWSVPLFLSILFLYLDWITVYARLNLVSFPKLAAACGQILFGALFNTIFAVAVDYVSPPSEFGTHFSFFADASLKAWLSIVYLGVFSTVVAYSLYFYLIGTVGSVKVEREFFSVSFCLCFSNRLLLRYWSTHDSLDIYVRNNDDPFSLFTLYRSPKFFSVFLSILSVFFKLRMVIFVCLFLYLFVFLRPFVPCLWIAIARWILATCVWYLWRCCFSGRLVRSVMVLHLCRDLGNCSRLWRHWIGKLW